MDVRPILDRELLTATRKTNLWQGREFFAGLLLAVILATFGARYYWDHGNITNHELMACVALEAFGWMLLAHALAIFVDFSARAATSIALEKDRRTLDFLLATRLSNAEIVLGKFAACSTFLVASFAAGLPIMLLVHLLGGVDLRLIALAYAGLTTTAFFMIALAIWISTNATSARVAVAAAALWMAAWLGVPFFLPLVSSRLGIRLPALLLAACAWVQASAPLGFLWRIVGGTSARGFVDPVARMCGLQLAGGLVLLLWAIVRLRSAYRRNVSSDYQTLAARLSRPGWRWRPKPPVGDDPILWREMHTAREGLFTKLLNLVIWLGFYAMLIYLTYFFARPALIEVWRHGYRSGITSDQRPEWNLAIRWFMSGVDVSPPADVARVEFNLYLRFITTPLVFVIVLVAAGMAAEAIISERTRETWGSLIATPLSGRDIFRSNMLAAIWRMRVILTSLLALWTLGLVAGAIHPVGYVVSLLGVAAWAWLMLVFGMSAAIAAKDMAASSGRTMLFVFLTTGSLALPFFMPRLMNSVLLGAGSLPFVSWLSLVSYRDVRNAWQYPVYPALQWMYVDTGEGPIPVAATCLIGVLFPTLWGYYLWRTSLANFDRLIGRPCFSAPPSSSR